MNAAAQKRAAAFATAMRAWREPHSVREAARALGVTAVWLETIEDGRIDPHELSPSMATRLESITGLSASALGFEMAAAADLAPAPARDGPVAPPAPKPYSPTIAVRPRVRLASRDDGRCLVILEMTEWGHAMPPEQAALLIAELAKHLALALA